MRFALFALLLSACGTSAPLPVYAPPPFTAAQLRAGFVHDRTYTFRQEDGGAPIRVLRMLSATESGCVMWSQEEDGLGNALRDPKVSEYSWEELESHALWNAPITTITEETLTTPAGTHQTLRYTVVTPVATVNAWFDRALPGPPVRYEEQGQSSHFIMELIALKPGG